MKHVTRNDFLKEYRRIEERVRRLEIQRPPKAPPKHVYEHWWTVSVNNYVTDEIDMGHLRVPNTVVSRASAGMKYITGWQAYVDLATGSDHSGESGQFKIYLYDAATGDLIGTMEDRSFFQYSTYVPAWNDLFSEDVSLAGAVDIDGTIAIPFNTDISFDPWIVTTSYTSVIRLGIGLRFQVI